MEDTFYLSNVAPQVCVFCGEPEFTRVFCGEPAFNACSAENPSLVRVFCGEPEFSEGVLRRTRFYTCVLRRTHVFCGEPVFTACSAENPSLLRLFCGEPEFTARVLQRTRVYTCVLCLCSEPSPEPERLEQPGETVPLSDQTLSERVRVHRTALPAQVTRLLLLLWCLGAVWEGLQDDIRCACLSGRRMMGNSTSDIRF